MTTSSAPISASRRDAMTGPAPILALDKVTAGYGLITVLNDVSIRLHPREIVAVLGANGSGKSTILKTSAGLTRVLSGAVSFAGADVTRWPAHRRAAEGLGYVPQTRNVFPDLTVADNLRMGAFLRPKSFARDVEAVFALFPRIRERRRALACTLSGGERRMLSIALTLLLKPRALLLDEPSSDLSPSWSTRSSRRSRAFTASSRSRSCSWSRTSTRRWRWRPASRCSCAGAKRSIVRSPTSGSTC